MLGPWSLSGETGFLVDSEHNKVCCLGEASRQRKKVKNLNRGPKLATRVGYRGSSIFFGWLLSAAVFPRHYQLKRFRRSFQRTFEGFVSCF